MRDAQYDLGHPQCQEDAEENGDQTENEFSRAGHVLGLRAPAPE